MTTSLQKKTIIEPDLTEVLSIFKLDVLSTLHCVKIGSIKSYDGETHTAQVQIVFKRVLPNKDAVDYPLLIDVPVFTLQGGGAALQVPVSAGDPCILLFSDRQMDEWYQDGGQSAPGTPRLHDMSDAIALVGINPVNGNLPSTASDKAILSYKGNSVELDATHLNLVSTGGAELDLIGQIATLKNTTTTLLTLLNGLITVMEGLQVNGPIPLTAASIASLEAYKTTLATLLG